MIIKTIPPIKIKDNILTIKGNIDSIIVIIFIFLSFVNSIVFDPINSLPEKTLIVGLKKIQIIKSPIYLSLIV